MRALLAASLCGILSCNDYKLKTVPPSNDGVDTGPSVVDTGDGDAAQADGTTGSIRGRVCDFSGESYVVGASVVVSWDSNGDGTDDGSAADTTDSEGWFQLDGVPLGLHTVRVQKGSFTTQVSVDLSEPGLLLLAEEECLEQNDVKIAVINGGFDDIGAILSRMELEFDSYRGQAVSGGYLELLLDPEALAEYDIVFFNCGIATDWAPSREEVGQNIRTFVENGGSIYASDYAHVFFEEASPTAIDFVGDDDALLTGSPSMPAVGLDGRIEAQVFDPNMMAAVGSNRVELSYDLDGWVVPVSILSSATAMVRGDARTFTAGVIEDAPLAVKLERNGVAIFTTFHNEWQITIDMETLLEEIILNL